jgi:hypothetical protein
MQVVPGVVLPWTQEPQTGSMLYFYDTPGALRTAQLKVTVSYNTMQYSISTSIGIDSSRLRRPSFSIAPPRGGGTCPVAGNADPSPGPPRTTCLGGSSRRDSDVLISGMPKEGHQLWHVSGPLPNVPEGP